MAMRRSTVGFLAAIAAIMLSGSLARAEPSVIRGGMQFGFSYLQLTLMQDQHLIEKHAMAGGLGDVTVEWLTLAGPAPLTDALLSGSLDFAAMGLPNMITLWAKTRGNLGVRAISGMNAHPLLLVTRNPRIRTIDDYGPDDRIALPSVKVSMQAIALEIAAMQRYGAGDWQKLDPLTVSMAHPDAAAALLSGHATIGSPFSSPPFQARELATPGIHRVLSSYDAIGPHSVSAITTTARFHDQNPKAVAAILAALEEATQWIGRDKRFAAEAYARVTKDKTPIDDLVGMIADADIEFTRRPLGAQKIADFLFQTGAIKQRPERWQDLYFAEAHGLAGN
jgi:NitT/TauT family transport system substrate-binding protein